MEWARSNQCSNWSLLWSFQSGRIFKDKATMKHYLLSQAWCDLDLVASLNNWWESETYFYPSARHVCVWDWTQSKIQGPNATKTPRRAGRKCFEVSAVFTPNLLNEVSNEGNGDREPTVPTVPAFLYPVWKAAWFLCINVMCDYH